MDLNEYQLKILHQLVNKDRKHLERRKKYVMAKWGKLDNWKYLKRYEAVNDLVYQIAKELAA